MKKLLKMLANNLAYTILGILLAISAGVAIAANVTVPSATEKGDVLTGVSNKGNYQIQHPCANGQILVASSTATTGWTCVSNAASSGATTTITSNILINGPDFTFATGIPDTNLGLNITGSGSTITYQPVWIGTLADNRIASAATWNGKQNALSFPLAVNLGGTGSTTLFTTLVAEGTNLYYLDSRARGAISASATPITYDSATGKIGWTNSNNYITLSSLSGTAPISYNNSTGAISIPVASSTANGYLSSGDWTTFNSKQASLTTGNLTATSPLVFDQTRQVIGGAAVVSIPLASSTASGYLSSTDWATFNGKQAAGAYLTTVAADSPLGGSGTAGSHLTCTGCLTAAVTSLNGLTGASQTFATTTGGTLWTITSTGTAHTWNIPATPTFTGITVTNATATGLSTLASTTISSLTLGNGVISTFLAADPNGKVISTTTPGGLASYNVVSANNLLSVSTSTTLATLTVNESPSFTGTLGVAGVSTLASTTISSLTLGNGVTNSFLAANVSGVVIATTTPVLTNTTILAGTTATGPALTFASSSVDTTWNITCATATCTFKHPNNLLTAAITSLNGLTGATQTFATTTGGTLWTILSSGTSHTWNIPAIPTFTGVVVTNATTTTLSNSGYLRDSVGSLGSNGNALISTGTSTLWSSIGSGTVTGTGVNGYGPRWTSASALAQGALIDDGTEVGINASTTGIALTVKGIAGSNNVLTVASSTGVTVFQITPAGMASTTSLTVSNVQSALLLTSAAGVASGYAGASNCSSGQAVIGLSALGATTCSANGLQAALTNPDTGTGTNGQVAYFTGSTALASGAKLLFDGTNFGFNATSSTIGFNIQGTPGANDILNIASSSTTSLAKFTAAGNFSLATLTASTILTSDASKDIQSGTLGGGLSLTSNKLDLANGYFKTFWLASTTVTTIFGKSFGGTSSGTSTIAIMGFPMAVTLTRIACITDAGNVNVNLGSSAGTSTSINIGTSVASTTASIALAIDQSFYVNASSSNPTGDGLRCTIQAKP